MQKLGVIGQAGSTLLNWNQFSAFIFVYLSFLSNFYCQVTTGTSSCFGLSTHSVTNIVVRCPLFFDGRARCTSHRFGTKKDLAWV